MRGFLISLAAAFVLAISAPAHASVAKSSSVPSISSPSTVVYALQQTPDKQIDINISTNKGGGKWYANPMWIAIGAVAVAVHRMRQRARSESRPCATSPTMFSAMPSARRALPVKSMSLWTYARASAPMAGADSAFKPRHVRARISSSGSEDNGTRPPSGSTSVTGTFRPPYRLVMIFCSGSVIG